MATELEHASTEIVRPSGFEVNPAVRRAKSAPASTKQTYSIAHTAQCKLRIAANRPDRNLRFVLGHAFTLDKVLLRIVEIENQSAKDELDNDKPVPRKSEIEEEDDARAGVGGGAGVRVGETGSLAQPKRRISFSNQTKPSEITGRHSPARAKSPPPKTKNIPKSYEDDESTDSDEYDEPEDFARAINPQSALNPPAYAEDKSDDDDAAIDDYDQEEDTGLGLSRFASATAAKPRMRSPSPPPMSESDSEEDEEGPKSPPAFPDDMVRGVMIEGEEATELHGLYEQIKSCRCGGDQHAEAPHSKGMWTFESKGDDGTNHQYGVVKV